MELKLKRRFYSNIFKLILIEHALRKNRKISKEQLMITVAILIWFLTMQMLIMAEEMQKTK